MPCARKSLLVQELLNHEAFSGCEFGVNAENRGKTANTHGISTIRRIYANFAAL